MAPRDPSSCRGWMRLSCGPAFQQTVRTAVSTTTKVDVPSGAYRSPVRCDAVRFSIGSDASTVKGHGRLLPAVSATTARSRMGARVLASGMPVGIRLCGVRRRHLFGCQGALSVLMGAGHPRLRDYQRRIHTARVQRGGVNPRPCARGFGAMSLWPVSDWPVGRRLKLALRVEYSTPVLGVCQGDGWVGASRNSSPAHLPTWGAIVVR